MALKKMEDIILKMKLLLDTSTLKILKTMEMMVDMNQKILFFI